MTKITMYSRGLIVVQSHLPHVGTSMISTTSRVVPDLSMTEILAQDHCEHIEHIESKKTYRKSQLCKGDKLDAMGYKNLHHSVIRERVWRHEDGEGRVALGVVV